MADISILICTLDSRERSFSRLLSALSEQIKEKEGSIQILIEQDNGELSIGAKRNLLLKRAQGEYLCFIDDDDMVCSEYINLLMNAVVSDCDCASLRGMYFVDDKFEGIFEHSLKYNEWKTNPEGSEIKFLRTPNHLSLMRSSIAKQFNFPDKSWSEDHDWSKQIHKSGLLKTEYYIEEILYYYKYKTKK